MNYEEFLLSKNSKEEEDQKEALGGNQPVQEQEPPKSFDEIMSASIAAEGGDQPVSQNISSTARAKYYDAMGLSYPASLQEELLRDRQKREGKPKHIDTHSDIPKESTGGYKIPAMTIDGKEYTNVLPAEDFEYFQKNVGSVDNTIHKLKLFGEQFSLSSAGLVDFIREFPEDFSQFTTEVLTPEQYEDQVLLKERPPELSNEEIRKMSDEERMEYLKSFVGVEQRSGNFANIVKSGILSVKGIFGDDSPELTKPKDMTDIPAYLAGQLIGPSAVGKAIQYGANPKKAVDTATTLGTMLKGKDALKPAATPANLTEGGLAGAKISATTAQQAENYVLKSSAAAKNNQVRMWDNYTKTELGINLSGIVSGTAYFGLQEGTLEDKVKTAETAAALASFGSSILQGFVPKSLPFYNKSKKFKNLVESEDVYKMSEAQVSNYLAGLVPEDEVPAILKRMDAVRRIQVLEPDFKPTVGNIVGTEEIKFIQRTTDSRNKKFASDRYYKTKAAVERLKKSVVTEKDPTKRAEIAQALESFKADTIDHIEGLRKDILESELNLRSVKGAASSPSDAGASIRTSLQEMKTQYKDAVNELYEGVDPDNTVRFSMKDLSKAINTTIKSSDFVEAKLDVNTIPADVAAMNLAKLYLKKIRKENKKAFGTELTDKGTTLSNTLNFNQLDNLRKAFEQSAANLKRTSPGSEGYKLFKKLAKEIDDTIESKMVSNVSEGISARYKEARQFTRESYFSRFKDGFGSKLLDKENASSTKYAVDDDAIGPMFWKAGLKESSLKEFNETFSKDHIELRLLDDSSLTSRLEASGVDDVQKVRSDIAEELSQQATDALESYALRTLDDAINKSETASPYNSLVSWKKKYETSLDQLPNLKEKIEGLEDIYRREHVRAETNTAKILELEKDVVNRYSDIDSEKLLDTIVKGTTKESEELLQDIYRSMAAKADYGTSSEPYKLLYPDTIDTSKMSDEMLEFRESFSNTLVSRIVEMSYDAKSQSTSSTKLENYLFNNREKLEKILPEGKLRDLEYLNDAIRILGNENKNIAKPDLNILKETLSKFGISPASVLSRYYSAQLGKVGPLYLITDAVTRFATGMTDAHFDRAHKNLMYDLDGLAKVLEAKSSPENAEMILTFRESLKKATYKMFTKSGPKAFFEHITDPNLLTAIGRINIDDITEKQEDSETYEEYQERILVERDARNDLVEAMLFINDENTGQQTRLYGRFDGLEDDETSEDVLDEDMKAILRGEFMYDSEDFMDEIYNDEEDLLADEEELEPIVAPDINLTQVVSPDGQLMVTSQGRPVYTDDDGEFVTERTVTISVGDQWLNIPTVYDGEVLDEGSAYDKVYEAWEEGGEPVDPITGYPLPLFETVEEAVDAAAKRSESLSEELYELSKGFTPGDEGSPVEGQTEAPSPTVSQPSPAPQQEVINPQQPLEQKDLSIGPMDEALILKAGGIQAFRKGQERLKGQAINGQVELDTETGKVSWL